MLVSGRCPVRARRVIPCSQPVAARSSTTTTLERDGRGGKVGQTANLFCAILFDTDASLSSFLCPATKHYLTTLHRSSPRQKLLASTS